MTDSRFADYQEKFGDKSWELDALEPKVLVDLIRDEISKYLDGDLWDLVEKEQKRGQAALLRMSKKLDK